MEIEKGQWVQYCHDYVSMQFAKISGNSGRLWSIAGQYPNLISCLHAQTRLMSNFGLNRGVS